MSDIKYLSRIRLPDGTIYEIKDAEARANGSSASQNWITVFNCGTSESNSEKILDSGNAMTKNVYCVDCSDVETTIAAKKAENMSDLFKDLNN